MKVSNIVIIALLGLIAFLLLHPSDGKKATDSKSAAETDTPPPKQGPRYPQQPPVLAPKTSLVMVRGTVASISPDGMIIDSVKLPDPQRGTALDDARLAKEADEQEMTQWGPLLMARDNMVHRAEFEPPAKTAGSLLLKDHPFQFQMRLGDRVKVVAVPLTEKYTYNTIQLPVCTMRFTIQAGSAEPGGVWMWQKKGALDR